MSTKFMSVAPQKWNEKRLREILSLVKGKRILVVGDVGVDRYVKGAVERISPEAPVPIVAVEEESLKLGLAANVADNIQALGGNAFLVGVIGRDRNADDFKKILKKSKVPPTHLVVDRGRRTVVKDRIVSEKQQLLRIDYEDLTLLPRSVEERILKKVASLLPKVDAVILEDYAKGLFSEGLTQNLIQLATKHKKVTLLDPNLKTPLSHYRGVSILTPNKKEAEELTGCRIRDGRSLNLTGQKLLRMTGARNVVVTLGRDGMAIFSPRTKKSTLIPTSAREVYDVSGAGDTVISVLGLGLAAGASIEESAILGNLAAGVEVGKRGTATVSQKEILQALRFFCS